MCHLLFFCVIFFFFSEAPVISPFICLCHFCIDRPSSGDLSVSLPFTIDPLQPLLLLCLAFLLLPLHKATTVLDTCKRAAIVAPVLYLSFLYSVFCFFLKTKIVILAAPINVLASSLSAVSRQFGLKDAFYRSQRFSLS